MSWCDGSDSSARKSRPPLTDAPTLHWPVAEDAERYIVQLSTDGFRNIAFSTDWHGITVETNENRIPDWIWALAVVEQVVQRQCLAVLSRERHVVGYGAFRRALVTGEPVD